MCSLSTTVRSLLLLGAIGATSCASTSQSAEASDGAPKRPIGPIVEATNTPDAIGTLLAKLDASIRAWTTLAMTARSADERRKASLLEQNLMYLTHNRVGELIEQLETGPPYNQIVAAAALGFTRDPEAHSPLIAALESTNTDIVSNALLGLALLGRIDTPLERVCNLASTSPDAWVRGNAAQCLSTLTQAGARAECVLSTARAGLADAEPVVRAQCALILATELDAESMQSLETLLQDKVTLVGAASARALAHIGTERPAFKGTAARALTAAYEKGSESLRPHVMQSMIELAGVSLGESAQEWSEWARGLP